jgi:hypothetical protein
MLDYRTIGPDLGEGRHLDAAAKARRLLASSRPPAAVDTAS